MLNCSPEEGRELNFFLRAANRRFEMKNKKNYLRYVFLILWLRDGLLNTDQKDEEHSMDADAE